MTYDCLRRIERLVVVRSFFAALSSLAEHQLLRRLCFTVQASPKAFRCLRNSLPLLIFVFMTREFSAVPRYLSVVSESLGACKHFVVHCPLIFFTSLVMTRLSFKFSNLNAKTGSRDASSSTMKTMDRALLTDSGLVKADDLPTCALRVADVAAGVIGGVPIAGPYLGGAMQSVVHQAQVSNNIL